MIILDTNVISELRKPFPNENVKRWLFGEDRSDLYLCSIVVMEQRYGAEKTFLKSGSDRYHRALDYLLAGQFRDRVVDLNIAASVLTGKLRAKCESIGRAISVQDAMIAAICLHHGATLATRNTKDFEGLDLKLVNPFEDG
jgi:predicted nucleic acid-binding protein